MYFALYSLSKAYKVDNMQAIDEIIPKVDNTLFNLTVGITILSFKF